MEQGRYQIRYTPTFRRDLFQTLDYISVTLENPDAAEKLLNTVEKAINERLTNPKAFEMYSSKSDREHPYYRIYVKNYTLYYVVIDGVMEVRRLLYRHRNAEKLL